MCMIIKFSDEKTASSSAQQLYYCFLTLYPFVTVLEYDVQATN